MATVKGVWVFNKTIDLSILSTTKTYGYPFALSDGTIIYHFKKTSNYGGGFCLSYMIQGQFTVVYSEKSYGADASVGWVLPLYMTIDFGETPIEVSDTIDTFIRTNAVQQTSEDEDLLGATITYNDSNKAVKVGETATLPCAGKKAKSDIVIEFYSAGTIIYNSKETMVETGKVATLSCTGKKMLTDIVVTVNAGEQSKEYAITYVKNVACSITDAPETIKEGEIVSFTVQAFVVLDIVATNADIESTPGGAGKYYCVLSNPTGNVTVTISEWSKDPPPLGL